MNEFLCGVAAVSFLGGGLFLFRFWKQTGDRFLFYFGIACWLLAFEKLIVIALEINHEEQSFVYLIRLAAFSLIIFAVIRKNIRSERS